jgi:hypothetical protein
MRPLPSTTDYYRPTRARELRARAARMKALMVLYRGLAFFFYCASLSSVALALLLVDPGIMIGAFAGAFAGWLGIAASEWVKGQIPRDLIREADALEREHTSRYGRVAAASKPVARSSGAASAEEPRLQQRSRN